jgi:hypothetical protein
MAKVKRKHKAQSTKPRSQMGEGWVQQYGDFIQLLWR